MEPVYDSTNNNYTRATSVDRTIVSSKIKALYGIPESFVCSSGMNAIYIALKAIGLCNNRHDCTILASDELYCETSSKILTLINKEFNRLKIIKFKSGDTSDLTQKITLHKSTLVCVFTEGASNPSGKMIDWDIVNGFIPSYCYLVVDNTWLTPIIFNPFQHHAHIVVDSCTKYLSKGECIAGIIGVKDMNDPVTKEISFLIRSMGIHVSPVHCKLVCDGLDGLSNRIQLTHTNTSIVLNRLQQNHNVINVVHQTIPTHESYTNYIKYTTGQASGVIWFYIKYNKNKLKGKNWKNDLGTIFAKNNISYETSFGKAYYLIDRWPVMKNDKIGLRLSIGYEDDPNEFCNKLEKALFEINTTDDNKNYNTTCVK